MRNSHLNRASANQLKLKRIKPDIYFYRAYAYQSLNSGFGFTETSKSKFNSFGKDLKELTIQELNQICSDYDDLYFTDDNNLVEWFYYFDKDYEFVKEDYKKFPTIFTDIMQVSFDQDGLVIMQLFGNQIYELYTFNGKYISGPCHDLDILINGEFLERSSESSYGFELNEYRSTSKSIRYIEKFGDFDVERMLGINNRDRIQFNESGLPTGRIENFPQPSSREDAKSILLDENTNWVTSPELIKYFENDLELALIAVKREPLAFTLLAPTLQKEKLLQLLVFNFEYCNEYHFNLMELFSFDELKKRCKEDNDLFKFLPIELKSNKEFILSCLNQTSELNKCNTNAIKYIDDSLKNDFEIGLLSIKNNISNLNYLSDNLKNDFLFIRKAICFNENAYRFASEELRNNKELIFFSKYYHDFPSGVSGLYELRDNLDFTSKDIIRPNTRKEAFKVLSDETTKWITSPELIKFYENDVELALIAVKRESNAFHFLSNQLKQDSRLQKLAFNLENCDYYNFKMNELYTIEEIINHCKQDNRFFKFLPDNLKSDKNFILKCMKKDYHPDIYDFNAIQYLSETIRNDFDIAMKFVMLDGLNLKWLSNELKNNFEIVKQAIYNNNQAIQFASDELKMNENMILFAINDNVNSLFLFPEQIRNNKFFISVALKKDFNIYYSLPEKLKQDNEILSLYNSLIKENTNGDLPF